MTPDSVGPDFAGFVAERQRRLLRFAMVLSSDSRVAEDIVSDVLGRTFEQWDRIGVMADPNAYVRRMVVNGYLTLRRGWVRTRPSLDARPRGDTIPDPSIAHAERDAMLARLRELPSKQRAIVVLRYYEGLGDADIAEVLGGQPSTVRSQLARALAKLRIDPAFTRPPPPAASAPTRKDEI